MVGKKKRREKKGDLKHSFRSQASGVTAAWSDFVSYLEYTSFLSSLSCPVSRGCLSSFVFVCLSFRNLHQRWSVKVKKGWWWGLGAKGNTYYYLYTPSDNTPCSPRCSNNYSSHHRDDLSVSSVLDKAPLHRSGSRSKPIR